MTYEATDATRRGGTPRHLFVFTLQGVSWRYTSAGRDVTIGGKTYLSAAIERSAIKETAEKPQDQITITIPYMRDPDAAELPVTQPLGDNWHPFIPSDQVSVMCLEYHETDPDQEARVEWMGIVLQPKFSAGKLTLTCVPHGYAERNRYAGPKAQRGCWKTVYSTGPHGCNLDDTGFITTATLTAVDGIKITAPEFSSPTLGLTLAGGKVSWIRADGVQESRSVMAHDGDTLTLLYGAGDLAAGTTVYARPGCERTWDACEARGNTDNYGGSVYMPVQNPYGGNGSMSWG